MRRLTVPQTTNEQCCQLMQAAWNKRFTNINEVFVKLVQVTIALR